MTSEDLHKDLGSQFLVVGPNGIYGLMARTVGGWYGRFTIHPERFEEWIKPEKVLHPIKTPTTQGRFHEKISRRWWRRRGGDHGGGSFNEELYIKYLQAQIK